MNNFEKSVLTNFKCKTNITNDYLDDIIQCNLSNELENTWSFCFRDLSKNDMSNIDLHKLLKCSFSNNTKFPNYIEEKISIKEIFKLANIIDFGYEKLNVNDINFNLAIIDQPFKKENKSFAKKVIPFSNNPLPSDSANANIMISMINKLLPNSTIFYFDNYLTFEGRYKALCKIYDYNLVQNNERKKIHCVCLSVGLTIFQNYTLTETQGNMLYEIVDKLQNKGCYIIDSKEIYNSNLYISSPKYSDDFKSVIAYEPGQDWFCKNNDFDINSNILIPGGGKLYAYPAETDKYYYAGTASYCWAIPIIASFFVICKSKKNDLSFKEFKKKISETYTTNKLGYKEINIYNLYNSL